MKIAILSYGRGGEYFTRVIRVSHEIESIEQLPEITPELLKLAGIDDADLSGENGHIADDDEATWVILVDVEQIPKLPGVLDGIVFTLPTYYGSSPEGMTKIAGKEEFDSPHAKVLVRDAEGLKIVLGSDDFNDFSVPDVQIERRPQGWAIFLHPEPGGDPCGVAYYHKGHCYFLNDNNVNTEGNLRVVNKQPEEIDQIVIDAEWEYSCGKLHLYPLTAQAGAWIARHSTSNVAETIVYERDRGDQIVRQMKEDGLTLAAKQYA